MQDTIGYNLCVNRDTFIFNSYNELIKISKKTINLNQLVKKY